MVNMPRHESAAKNRTKYRQTVFAAHRLEPLEPRKLLSTVMGANDNGSDPMLTALAMSVNATWFEDLVPQSNQSAGVNVQVVDGEADQSGGAINHEWLIQLTADASVAAGTVTGAGQLLGLTDIGVQVIRGLGSQGLILVNDANITGDQSLTDFLADNQHIEFIASNYEFDVASLPNDPYFNTLWGLNNTGQSGGTVDADIDAPEAWAMLDPNAQTVVVAVIDSGVDYNHPDLVNNIWTNPGEIPGNGIDDDGNGFIDDIHGWDFANNDASPMDDNGHGTHVAGTIAGTPNNATGVTGVAPNAQIMALKFITAAGSGSTSNAIRALNYATMMNTQYGVNVRVTNNSWGGGGYSAALYNAIKASGQAGIVFIASAGNDGNDIDASPSYPAAYNLNNIISVAATDRNDQLASFSNYGSIGVDIAAPGVTIRSTLPGNSYGYYSGTSMASPHVTGAVAMYLGQHPDADVAEVTQAVINGGDLINAVTGKTVSGRRLNLVGMLNEASSTPNPTPDPDPTPDPNPTPAPVPSADVAITLVSNPWDELILPEQRGSISVTFENQGDLVAKGKADVSFYLSSDTTLDNGDLLVYQKTNYSLNLRQGQSKTTTFKVTIPADLPQGSYHLIAVMNADQNIADNNASNDVFVSDQTHELVWMVGNVNGMRNSSLELPDADGHMVRFSLSGSGTAVISGDTGAQTITLSNTDSSTRFTIKGLDRDVDATIGDILVLGSMGKLTADHVNLMGDLTIDGSISSIRLDDMTDGSITIGLGQGKAATIRMDIATDVTIVSLGEIRSLTADAWVDTDFQTDSITAASIGSLTVRGDMVADVTTTNAEVADLRANISGSILGGTWQIAGGVYSLRTTDAITDFTLVAGGDIRSISTGRDSELNADIQANYIGSVQAAGLLTGSLTATGADSRGRGINTVYATQINEMQITAADGDIRSISTRRDGELNATIQANSIASVRAGGLLTGSLTATGADSRGRGINTVYATQINEMQITAADGDIRSISTRRDGELNATIQANSIGSIRAGGLLTGSLTATGADSRGRAFGTIHASQINNLDINAAGDVTAIRIGDIDNLNVQIQGELYTFTGRDISQVDLLVTAGIRSISLYNWDGGSVTADHITTFKVRENVTDVDVELTQTPDADVQQKRAMNSLRVYGIAQGLNLTANSEIKTITVGAMFDSQINVGVDAGPQGVLDDVQFGAYGSVGSFTIRGIRGMDGATFDNSAVLIKHAGKVSLKEVDLDDDSQPYGMVFESVDKFSRSGTDQTIRLYDLNELGIQDQAGTFILRIL